MRGKQTLYDQQFRKYTNHQFWPIWPLFWSQFLPSGRNWKLPYSYKFSRGQIFAHPGCAKSEKFSRGQIFAHPGYWKISRRFNFAHPRQMYSKTLEMITKIGTLEIIFFHRIIEQPGFSAERCTTKLIFKSQMPGLPG